MIDYFQSHTLSLILTWVFSIALIPGAFILSIGNLFDETEGFPRSFIVWLVICLLLFSPLRYILLQLLVAIAYPLQSFRALFTTVILAFYIPIVFAILLVIGVGAPLLITLAVAGLKAPQTKVRLWFSALAAPFVFIVAGFLYFMVLPFAAYSTHWLNADDVIRATNGPTEYFYRYVAEPMTPMQYPGYITEMGLDNLSPRERLRAHVAVVYLGDKQFSFFMYKSYPDEFKRKTGYLEQ